MTSPGRYRNEPPDITDRILRIESRLQALEANPRAGNTTIDTGAFQVKDATGSVRLRMGLLSDNTYGIEVKEDGQDNFHQVPYVYTQQVFATQTCSSTSFTDLTTPGPFVTVPVRSSQRILVLATAQMQWSIGFAATVSQRGDMGIQMSGANSITPNIATDLMLPLIVDQSEVTSGTTARTLVWTITGQAVYENLNPGNTTIKVQYRKSGSSNVDFSRRTITVITL